MSQVIIKLLSHANGYVSGHEGQYLKSMDFEAHDGRGEAGFTEHLAEALRFADKGAALAFWKTQSKVRPMRPDGKPNRPLTASTVEIIELTKDGHIPKPNDGIGVGQNAGGATIFECPHCRWAFMSMAVIQQHIREKHS
jgi:hypothetical protein